MFSTENVLRELESCDWGTEGSWGIGMAPPDALAEPEPVRGPPTLLFMHSALEEDGGGGGVDGSSRGSSFVVTRDDESGLL